MREFLCPTTGKPCEQAQAMGEVLGEQVLGLFRAAADNVSKYGNFAPLEMRVDPVTIRNIQRAERFAANDAGRVKDAIVASRNDVVDNLLPVFLDCGLDESGTGVGCGVARDNEAKRTATHNALSSMTQGMMEYLDQDKQN